MKIISLFIIFFIGTILYADSDLRQIIIETAKSYQGVAYRYGAESPRGFDCSGFVRFVYRNATGIELPRSSRNIWNAGKTIKINEALPGDIVVFVSRIGGTTVDHVAILLDENSIIHAVSSGPKTGVIISPITDKYFGPRILGVASFIIPSIIQQEDIIPDIVQQEE